MINSDFFCQFFSTPTFSSYSFGEGFLFVFSILRMPKGRKGGQGNPLPKTKRTQGRLFLCRGDERVLLFDNEGVWMSLIKPADTQCWAAQNTRAGGGELSEDKSSHGPEGLAFCSAAVSNELKVRDGQKYLPVLPCLVLLFCSASFCSHQVRKERSEAPLRVSSGLSAQTSPTSPDVTFKQKSLLCCV